MLPNINFIKFIIQYDRAFGIYETVLVSPNVAVTQCTLKIVALE